MKFEICQPPTPLRHFSNFYGLSCLAILPVNLRHISDAIEPQRQAKHPLVFAPNSILRPTKLQPLFSTKISQKRRNQKDIKDS